MWLAAARDLTSSVIDLLPEFRFGSAFDPMMAGSRFL
jgi:hypothetical protein